MKTYIGTKVIKAEPCKAWKEMGKHAIGENGYRVVYPDGYISWSPEDVFEKAYHELTHDMTFGQALDALKAGQKASRRNWNGKGQYIYMTKGSNIPCCHLKADTRKMLDGLFDNDDTVAIMPHIDLKNAQNQLTIGWAPTQTDMLSNDWYIVE